MSSSNAEFTCKKTPFASSANAQTVNYLDGPTACQNLKAAHDVVVANQSNTAPGSTQYLINGCTISLYENVENNILGFGMTTEAGVQKGKEVIYSSLTFTPNLTKPQMTQIYQTLLSLVSQ